ncbi:hypothetical protein TPHA_0J00850 [Tetrapisispora phaffii CBS 4417]|uniref:beta-ketoacyl-[acyl-carrier-protein] synthase I n=1 Tax=Tetrapisispora phaffii (strain ATCC 24235 / CBS 4417 / NBRC 1672 / NRRL Y-8282 / UCD 70-5) TaxID=1071381 RepID=G8BYG6_TETPH|nr:hypothetical protein TPHA_0J00850 [Tetrapisispora phaffii CBS 4417]CCE64908.1 hypothetical protein TPHA_0J00850 [Tetrapisispora phaffii CBS 4417]
MSKRVVVTGLGCITPLGTSVRQSWSNLLNSNSGITNIKNLPNYESAYKQFSKSIPDTVSVAPVQLDETQFKFLFTDQDNRRLAKFSKFATIATYEALQDADLLWKDAQISGNDNTIKIDESKCDLDHFGCVIGSGIVSIDELYNTSLQLNGNKKKYNPLFVPKILTNMAAGNVAIKFNLRGPCHSVSTACATGNNSIGDAYNFIRLGMQDICVAGASEASIHPLSLAGFIRAMSITTDGISRPFDKNRSGFVLGEGAGILVLESLESALKRNAKIYCEIKGYGISCDAYHITSPSPLGDGASRAIKMSVGNSVDSVDYVNAHATSTKLGDIAEVRAIGNSLKTYRKPNNRNLYVSSNKGAMGHLLGAAGAIESIFTIKTLQENIIPHTLNLEELDPELQEISNGIEFVVNKPKLSHSLQSAICNSFGFGGINTSLLFQKYI